VYLTIHNLGRLESATIDLSKSFTVFVGRNNTSKTYVAHTIYALHRFGAGFLDQAVLRVVEKKVPPPWDASRYELDVMDALDPSVPNLIDGLARNLKARLPSVFATDDRFFAATQLSLSLADGEEAAVREWLVSRQYSIHFSVAGWRVEFRKPKGSRIATLDCTPSGSVAEIPATARTWVPQIIGFGVGDLLKQALLPGSLAPSILSTERSAIQLFSRELYGKRSQVIDAVLEEQVRAESVDLINKETRFYPLAIRDELRSTNQMPQRKLARSPLEPLAARLETLLGGAVVLDESGDLMFQPSELNKPLGLHVSSSSVKSLAGLAFYLRHVATEGGLLVIDEPELNLHPDNQRIVARILAQVALAGVRVLISTHSDYLIRELSVLIALHASNASALRAKYGYSESETIDSNSIVAYLFDQTTAHAIDVGTTGIEVTSIDNEINALNRIAKDVYFALLAEKPET